MYVPFEMRNPGPRPEPRRHLGFWLVTGALGGVAYWLLLYHEVPKLAKLLYNLTMGH